MSKLNHPAYGAHSLEPHTKATINFKQAHALLSTLHLGISKDYTFNDAEYFWTDDNNNLIAGAYKAFSEGKLDIWFESYDLGLDIDFKAKSILINQYKTISISRNDHSND